MNDTFHSEANGQGSGSVGQSISVLTWYLLGFFHFLPKYSPYCEFYQCPSDCHAHKLMKYYFENFVYHYGEGGRKEG